MGNPAHETCFQDYVNSHMGIEMTIIFELRQINPQWFARIEGRTEYGRGATREDALADLVMSNPELFGVAHFQHRLQAIKGVDVASTRGVRWS